MAATQPSMRRRLAADAGQKVAQFREQQQMRLEDLASRSGVSYEALRKIEAGRALASVETIEDLAKALGVEFAEIWPSPNGGSTQMS